MLQYFPTLVKNGFDEMDTLLELREEHLQDMDMPMGHRLKIIKRIRETKYTDRRSLSKKSLKVIDSPINDKELFTSALSAFKKVGINRRRD